MSKNNLIGSNFILKDKQLTMEMKKPFASLRARAGARAMYPDESENSLCVTIELPHPNQIIADLVDLINTFMPDVRMLPVYA